MRPELEGKALEESRKYHKLKSFAWMYIPKPGGGISLAELKSVPEREAPFTPGLNTQFELIPREEISERWIPKTSVVESWESSELGGAEKIVDDQQLFK